MLHESARSTRLAGGEVGSTAAPFLPKAAAGSRTAPWDGAGSAISMYRLCLTLHPLTWSTLFSVLCTADSSLVAP